MKINTSYLLGAVIALVVVFLTSVDAQNTPSKTEHQKWEYLHVQSRHDVPFMYDAFLNKQAEAGWELVHFQFIPRKVGEATDIYVSTYKRPKQ
jgi:hypothetical protein